MAETDKIIYSDEVPMNIESEEFVEFIETVEEESVDIDMDNAFPSSDAINLENNHALLNNRELSKQHPITAIEGLRAELDSIESLKTVYSDQKQQADYYLWYQDNEHTIPVNPNGLFVSFYPNTNCIQPCDGSNDVFGVTVAEAAFIGGRAYTEVENEYEDNRTEKLKEVADNGGQYGLVVTSGIASVRRETDVTVGDYVIPNSRGEAKKSDGNYGYLVTNLTDDNGVLYATISLAASSTLARTLADTAQDLSERISTAEFNIASVSNVANSAYALAQDAKENAKVNSEYLEEKISEVLGKMDITDEAMGNLSESVNNACETAALAKVIADGAVSSAESIRGEAVDTANNALIHVDNLIEKFEPTNEWVDPATGKISAEYIIEYMDNQGLATKAEVRTVESLTETNKSAIEQNAERIEAMVSSVDKYSVGETSQAYNLTLEQAKEILKIDTVYVPTVVHKETYDDAYIQEFSLGYYYTWNGEYWTPSLSNAVNFSSSYIQGTEATPYWLVTVQDVTQVDIIYDLGGLYLWQDDTWVKVASLTDNTLSRAVSVIKQTADSVSAEVINARGSYAGLGARLTNTESIVDSTAQWAKGKTEDGEETFNLSTIKQEADGDGSSLALVVADIEGNKVLKGASIVLGQNEKDSYIQIEADNINFEAENYTIDANRINFDAAEEASISASKINLEGAITISSLDSDTANKLNNSVASTTIEYALSDSSTTAPTSGWSTTAPAWQENKYMWQQTTITYTNHTKENPHQTVTKTCIQGAKGAAGGAGKSVTKLESEYCVSDNNITAPTSGWSTDFDSVLDTYYTKKKENPNTIYYIWSREKVTYSSGNPTYSTATVNSASSFIASWCDENDKTKINGGNIATGTITARTIQANAITADKLATDAITSRNYYTTDEDGNYTTTKSGNGMKLDLANGSWDSTYFKIKSDGSIIATGGTIGGYDIGSTTLQSINEKVGMSSSETSGSYAFWAGNATQSSAPFYVKNNGYMRAISGNIAGFDFTTSKLQSGDFILETFSSGDNKSGILKFVDTSDNTKVGSYINYSSISTATVNCAALTASGQISTPIGIIGDLTISESSIKYGNLAAITFANDGKDFVCTASVDWYGKDIWVETTLALPIDVVFTIHYKHWASSWEFTTITIKAGDKKGTKTTQHLFDVDNAKLYSDGLEYSSMSLKIKNPSNSMRLTGNLSPSQSETYMLGEPSLKWDLIYVDTLEVTTSDKNKKNTITSLSNKYEYLFDNLKPVSYKFNNNSSDRTHIGFIAQDVEKTIIDAGLTTQDFAGVCYWDNSDGTKGYGLRYGEFIPLNTHEIQKLKKRVAELEEMVKALTTQQND